MELGKEAAFLFDVIIKNGCLFDGTGNPWFKADVGIKSGKVLKIGDLGSEDANKIINAKGLVVSPGFIDMHSHSEYSLLANSKAESKIRQGVTTEVNGNCGDSPAPIEGITAEVTEEAKEYKLDIDWSTLGEYLDRLERQGIALNVAQLVGHGTIRTAVMGHENRPSTREELDEMKQLVAQAMKDGAFGMSTGLFYFPSGFADAEEVIELCRVVAKYGGIYTSHIRGEADPLIEAVTEAIARAGILREGMWADVVVFDPNRVVDEATYEGPHRYPEGIEYVLVNGEIVVDRGKHTGVLPGKVLRLSN